MGIVLALLLPTIFGIAYIFIADDYKKIRAITTVFATVSFVATIFACITDFGKSIILIYFPFGIDISFHIDQTAVFFAVVLSAVWYMIIIFSFEYMQKEGEQRRFYSFYIISYCGIIGLCFAQNLVTFYTFFEIMTFAGYFLIVHSRKQSTFMAGKKYLFYSLFGTGISLGGIFYLYSATSDTSFSVGGAQGLLQIENEMAVAVVAAITVVGFCAKAGLFPLHSWLSAAHPVAPAPASALLSAVMTKAGVLAAIRILYFIVPTELIIGTTVQTVLIALSVITIFLGSTLALFERYIKKRLAYSSVSQISYALFSLFLLNEYGLYGMFLQVLFHAFAKALLFMNAGVFINKLKVYNADELSGIYKHLKLPIITFALAGLSLVGIPFTGGFIAKWQIALGAISNNTIVAIVGALVIMLSAIITAGYLLPPVVHAVYNKSDKDYDEIKLEKTTTVPLIIAAGVIVIGGSLLLFFGAEIFSSLVLSVLG